MGHEMVMEPLDKCEVIDLINMMFKFQRRTGSLFKIEEYAEQTHVLTDVDLLLGSDLECFYKRNRDIAHQIWFTQLPLDRDVYNVYEDCPKTRRQYYASYTSGYNFMNILNRTQSMSFILSSGVKKKKKNYAFL